MLRVLNEDAAKSHTALYEVFQLFWHVEHHCDDRENQDNENESSNELFDDI